MDIRPPAVLRSHSRKRLVVAGVASGVGIVVVAAVLLIYFGRELRANEPKGGRGPAAVPVSVATVVQQTMPFRLQAIGNVEAFSTVAVKARGGGPIVGGGFKGGGGGAEGPGAVQDESRPG